MADNILTKDRADAPIDIAAKDLAGVLVPRNILTTPAGVDLSPLTDAELRAEPVPISAASLPLPAGAATQTTLASILAALGTPMQENGGSVSIIGTVPVSGTFWQATQPVSFAWSGLTDTQLRAAPVTVSGTVAVSGTIPVSGPLTDAQLRASAVPVSASSLPLPADAATQTTLAEILFALGSPVQAGGTVPVSGTFWQVTQPVSATSLPLPAGAATETTLAAQSAKLPATLGAKADAASLAVTHSTEDKAAFGALTETAPATDTASAGINGRLQRIAQRLTSLIGLLPTSLGPKAGASSLSTVEATPTAVTIVSLTTSATGASYVAFGSQACEQLDLVNTHPTAVDLEIRRGGSGNTIIVPAGSSRMFVGLSNASDLQVRRLDQSNAQITFTAEAIKQ